MRCEVCEQRKVKCSLNTGVPMSLRQCMKEGRPAKLTELATSYIYHPTNIPSWEYTPSPPHTRPPPLDRQQLSTPQATVDTIRNRKAQQAPAGARQTRSMTRQHEVESESEEENLIPLQEAISLTLESIQQPFRCLATMRRCQLRQ